MRRIIFRVSAILNTYNPPRLRTGAMLIIITSPLQFTAGHRLLSPTHIQWAMERTMLGVSLRDRIWNEAIQQKTGQVEWRFSQDGCQELDASSRGASEMARIWRDLCPAVGWWSWWYVKCMGWLPSVSKWVTVIKRYGCKALKDRQVKRSLTAEHYGLIYWLPLFL
jgi:hypothetical protein